MKSTDYRGWLGWDALVRQAGFAVEIMFVVMLPPVHLTSCVTIRPEKGLQLMKTVTG